MGCNARFSLLFSFAEPFCCKTLLMFFSFFEAGRKTAQNNFSLRPICLFMFFCIDLWVVVFLNLILLPTLKMGFVLWIHLEVQKNFPLKKIIDDRGRPSNKIPFKEAFKQLPKIPTAVLLPHFFVDPKKKPYKAVLFWVVPGRCFGFSLSFFFLAVFDSTKFPHRVKKKKTTGKSRWTLARCVSFEGLQSPIQTPEWSCQAGFQKNPRWGQLSCYALGPGFFFGWSTSPEAYWENGWGPGWATTKPWRSMQVKFVKIVDFVFLKTYCWWFRNPAITSWGWPIIYRGFCCILSVVS